VSIKQFSRRMFISSTGKTFLAIPFLQSLSNKAYAQAVSKEPVRYVQFMVNHGYLAADFWPSSQFAPNRNYVVNGQTIPDIRYRPLSEIANPISKIIGSGFNNLLPKMNLLRGLHGMDDSYFHNNTMCTTGGGAIPDDSHYPLFGYSLDYILEQSANFYPNIARVPALRLTPGVKAGYKWSSFSWATLNNRVTRLNGHQTNKAAFDEVFQGMNTGGGSQTEDPQTVKRRNLVDQVLVEYNSIVNGTKIGSEDKVLLSNYMDHLNELQRRLTSEAPSCNQINLVSETNYDLLHQNAIDIAVAAMACGVTRVVAYAAYQGSGSFYDEERFHTVSHDGPGSEHSAWQTWRINKMATMLQKMDAFKMADGSTLLDNSLVYYGNEYGAGPGHSFEDMPIITAGGAGGRFTTGNYVDFQNRPINSMIVSIFNGLGIPTTQFEKNGQAGFGRYLTNKSMVASQYIATDAAKRASLPLFVKS
jgi:hypothetical protein